MPCIELLETLNEFGLIGTLSVRQCQEIRRCDWPLLERMRHIQREEYGKDLVLQRVPKLVASCCAKAPARGVSNFPSVGFFQHVFAEIPMERVAGEAELFYRSAGGPNQGDARSVQTRQGTRKGDRLR